MIEALISTLIEHETPIAWMYLDTEGIVTCATGHALFTVEDALKLPWSHPDTVRAGYAAVKAAPAGKIASFYAHLTVCRLTPEAMKALLEADVEQVIAGLKKRLPELDAYPAPVQQALGDMGFNLGVSGLMNKFPTFVSAIRSRDWPLAAANCHRRGISEARNQATAALFQAA